MARQLVFDVRFRNSSNIGQQVDPNIRVEFFEEGGTAPVAVRTLGTNSDLTVVRSSDAEGVLYSTTLDVSNIARGAVTAKWYASLSGSPVNPYPFTESLSNTFADRELTPGDIKSFIRSMLGFPVVAVELTGAHFTAILEEALAAYSQHIPAERVMVLNYLPGQQVYPLPQLPYNGPFDVKFVRKVVTPIASDPLFGREYLRYNQPDLGTLIIGAAYLETMNRVLHSEPDWRWLHERKELYINVGPGAVPGIYGGYDISVRYFHPVTLDMVREDHFRWFRRYCLAQAKKILGQIRGKFSGAVPTPSGSMTLNHDPLTNQGMEEEQQLMEELRSMSPHVPPVFG
jgi:hypothetical protein